mgnify:FL=1
MFEMLNKIPKRTAPVIHVEHIPTLEPFDPNQPVGRDFNIILLVKEHAPTRITAIKNEVAALEKRLTELGKEATQLQKLLEALQ